MGRILKQSYDERVLVELNETKRRGGLGGKEG